MLISIVVPVFNEEDNIQNFYHAVTEVMRQGTYDYELIFVDDGLQLSCKLCPKMISMLRFSCWPVTLAIS